jgi:hypothetical protein
MCLFNLTRRIARLGTVAGMPVVSSSCTRRKCRSSAGLTKDQTNPMPPAARLVLRST